MPQPYSLEDILNKGIDSIKYYYPELEDAIIDITEHFKKNYINYPDTYYYHKNDLTFNKIFNTNVISNYGSFKACCLNICSNYKTTMYRQPHNANIAVKVKFFRLYLSILNEACQTFETQLEFNEFD